MSCRLASSLCGSPPGLTLARVRCREESTLVTEACTTRWQMVLVSRSAPRSMTLSSLVKSGSTVSWREDGRDRADNLLTNKFHPVASNMPSRSTRKTWRSLTFHTAPRLRSPSTSPSTLTMRSPRQKQPEAAARPCGLSTVTMLLSSSPSPTPALQPLSTTSNTSGGSDEGRSSAAGCGPALAVESWRAQPVATSISSASI
mmetsp:Transcript_8928/g.17982  ORF Transcript_8928/g.17982 Transcript_8928/m.17982 type:complete len:201 (-) Transcript_8928:5406-6008(-)